MTQPPEAPASPAEAVPQASGIPPEFSEPDERWAQDFHGLLYLGQLTSSFEWLGHRITIRTLNVAEELIISHLVHEWETEIGAPRAYATALAGMCVTEIDGQPMVTPLGEDDSRDTWARQRFAYAQRWYGYTIDRIYTGYLELEERAKTVLDELGKVPRAAGPGPSVTTGQPVPGDFSAAPGSL
jgi:hypothetical protein